MVSHSNLYGSRKSSVFCPTTYPILACLLWPVAGQPCRLSLHMTSVFRCCPVCSLWCVLWAHAQQARPGVPHSPGMTYVAGMATCVHSLCVVTRGVSAWHACGKTCPPVLPLYPGWARAVREGFFPAAVFRPEHLKERLTRVRAGVLLPMVLLWSCVHCRAVQTKEAAVCLVLVLVRIPESPGQGLEARWGHCA